MTEEQTQTQPQFQVPAEYAYTLLVSFIITVHYFVLGFWTMKVRISIFTKDFIKGNFDEEHKEAGIRTPAMGYPDFGNGYYSKKLSYKDWFTFNCALRVHQNCVEMFTPTLLSILAVGLFSPIASVVSGILYLLLRFNYGTRYMDKAQGVELAGFMIFALVFGNLGYSLYSVYQLLF